MTPNTENQPTAAPEALDAARRVLTERFHHSGFREGQEAIVDAALSGRDVLVIMPTGGGKSLCYQLPACVSDGVTLVISPLIALMKDQVDALTDTGIPAAAINSSLSFDAVRAVMGRVRSGEIKLLYVAPERFNSRYFMDNMAGVPVARVAVDEAHCISQWGHDFRPAYLRLMPVVEQLGRPPVIALTATATPTVQDDIIAQLGLREPARFVTGFDRANLTLEVRSGGRKKDQLNRFMETHAGPGIVYCATRRKVEEVVSLFREAGKSAVAYHAGLPDEEREAAQNAFIGGTVPIIAATNAFGMGVDKPDVRFVLHYDMPGTLEAYYQEAGRAGRDGLPATCTVLYGGGDRFTQEFFINASYPTEGFIRALWEVLVGAVRDEVVQVSHKEMLGRMGGGHEGSEMAISSALKLLEENGVLVRLNARNNPSTIRLIDRTRVGERAQVQQRLLSALEFMLPPGENGTVQVPMGQLAEDAGLDHDAALRAIHAMAEAGAIDYTPPFRGRGIRLLVGELPEIDFSAVDAKRRFALSALDAMEGYCRTPGCRREAILAHFGETGKQRCGACDRCLAGSGSGQRPQEATELARKLISGVARCRLKTADGYISFGVTTVATHLTGGNTEQIRRNRLDQVSTYGLLKQYTQKQVVELLNELIAQGLLRRDDMGTGPNRRPVLVITEDGLATLKGTRTGVLLTLPQPAEPATRTPAPPPDVPPADAELLGALKALRTRLSKEGEIPPYMVFADRALHEMAGLKPQNREALLQVNGVGPGKLEKYGDLFLAVIREFNLPSPQMEQNA